MFICFVSSQVGYRWPLDGFVIHIPTYLDCTTYVDRLWILEQELVRAHQFLQIKEELRKDVC